MGDTTIDREAWPAAAVGSVPALLAALTGHRRASVVLGLLPLGIVAFFRDPQRTVDSLEADEDVPEEKHRLHDQDERGRARAPRRRSRYLDRRRLRRTHHQDGLL